MCLHSSQPLPSHSYPCTLILVGNLHTSLSLLPYLCGHTLQMLQPLQPGTRDPALSLLKDRLRKVKPLPSSHPTAQPPDCYPGPAHTSLNTQSAHLHRLGPPAWGLQRQVLENSLGCDGVLPSGLLGLQQIKVNRHLSRGSVPSCVGKWTFP